MDDFALVLNAGSSSLKFCVFRRPESGEWGLEARGQVEGIGTSPHLSAKGEDGTKLVDERYDAAEVNNGDDAIKTLAAWLRSNYGGSRVLGVGHRVVHGGPNFDGPLAFDNAISREAATIKGIKSEVAGDPDILLAPDLEAGNILAKQLSFLAIADGAGMVLGARVPVILTSRADSVRSRIASCAVGMLVAHDRRSKLN